MGRPVPFGMHRGLLALAFIGAIVPWQSADLGFDQACRGVPATIVGTPGPDRLVGTPGDDVISGAEGDDVILGRGGDDVLCGGGGNDRIAPGTGDDVADGGPGANTLSFAHSRVPVMVDLTNQTALDGGTDLVASFDRVIGSRFGDVLLGSDAGESLLGRGGDDRVEGRGGDDQLRGGSGDDEIVGGAGVDRGSGGPGTNRCQAEAVSECTAGPVPSVVFLAPGGDDSAGGATPDSAVLTVGRGMDLLMDDGGTLFVLPGRYRQGAFFDGDHAAGGFRISGVGGRPTFDGTARRDFGVFCTQCHRLAVEWLRVVGFTDIGVGATLSTNVTLRYLEIVDNGHRARHPSWELEGYGIHVDGSSGVVIEHNVLTGNGPDPPAPGRLLGTAINTYGNQDVVIRHNRAHHNHGAGILVEDSRGALVEANEIYENDLDASAEGWWDGGIWIDGGSDVVLRDNLVHDNRGVGIEVSDEERQLPTGYVLEGNVSTGNYFGIYLWNFRTTDWPEEAIVLLGGDNDFSGNACRDVWIAPRTDFATCP